MSKQILIFSNRKDVSTHKVIEWLSYYNSEYIRVNSEETFSVEVNLSTEKRQVNFFSDKKEFSTDEIGAVWFRRGFLNISNASFNEASLSETYKEAITHHLQLERKSLLKFIYKILKQKPHINYPYYYNANKLHVLGEAQKVGLSIPDTLISKDNCKIESFLQKYNMVITKSIQDNLQIKAGGEDIMCNSTSIVCKDDFISNNKDEYYYSKFQKYIEKQLELRIFFLFDKFYSVAIYPWKHRIDIDGRQLEDNNNEHLLRKRICPFNVPETIITKLKALMKIIKLESGSIDMIVSPENKYCFLEVNPVGQFDYISQACNLHIEKEIARKLIEMNKI